MDNIYLDRKLLWRVLKYATPYKFLFASTAVLALVLAPVSVASPVLINKMVDDYIVSSIDIDGMTIWMIYLVGVILLHAALQYLFIYTTNLLGQLVIRDIRVKVFDHLVKLDLRFFDLTPIGTSTTRTINDIESINNIFKQGIITIIADVVGIFVVLITMFTISIKLTIICLITMPFMILASYWFKESVKKAYQKVRNQISRMNSFLQERITGMRIVQIFQAEDQEMEKFKAINRKYTQANLDSIFAYAVFFPVVEILSAISLGLMVWWGARGVLDESVTLGALIAFPLFLNRLFRPIRMIADKFNTLQMGLVAAERIFKVLDTDPAIVDSGNYTKDKVEGRIEFKNVNFAYDGKNKVIHDLNFKVAPGETLAIVGSTGSGKTTIINLLNRFYDIKEGQILIDGVNIQKYELEALRSHLAIVLQDVFLFSGTIFENITLTDPRFTMEDVIKASKIIGAHPFLESLPGGYDFKVTERGYNLSMGQRQLISFVRALVFDPDILILDEATSSIDTETESVIQHAIETLIQKRTSIIIAHRLSTVRHADQVMVMKNGRAVEIGSHEELLQKDSGHYRKLYDLQFIEHPLEN